METKSPLFSVLIANYNNGKYLRQCVDSVLNQTYSNWEIIILDDKSTDFSCEIYNQLLDNDKIRIYFNESNKGVGYVKHRLITLSNGDLFGFLDSDDRLEPNALEVMVQEHLLHIDCSLINSTYRLLTNTSTLATPPYQIGQIETDPDDLLLSIGTRVGHFATIKKEKYLYTNGMNPALRLAEDLDLYLKMEEVGNINFVDIPLYQYRVDNINSISIGDDKKRNNLYHVALVRLEAYRRRISSNYKNVVRYTSLYNDYMFVEMRNLLQYANQKDLGVIARYFVPYLKLNKCSFLSIKRIIKLILIYLGYEHF